MERKKKHKKERGCAVRDIIFITRTGKLNSCVDSDGVPDRPSIKG
jgi:hypothetical protein